MRRFGGIMVAAALGLAAGATAAQAQLAAIPVYFHPRGGTGIGVAADIGFPNSKYGGGTAYGVAGSLGAGPITLSAMVGAWKADKLGVASAQTSYGGDIAYRLFGGGLLPVSVAAQAGYGRVKLPIPLAGTRTTSTIPVGVGLSLDPPLFPLKPWIAPRMEFTHVSAGGTSTDASAFRVSAGVDFNVLLGFGVHAAVDWGKVPSKLDPSTPTTFIWSVGAHFNFHVPVM
jgi:hypothetical protein